MSKSSSKTAKSRLQDTDSMKAVQELVASAVSDPNALIKALGEPTKGGVHRIYQSDELTVLNLVWAPRMTLMPHNHNMAAVIGVYTGREDNIFWRRVKDDPSGRIEAAGADSLGPRQGCSTWQEHHPLGNQSDGHVHQRAARLQRRLL